MISDRCARSEQAVGEDGREQEADEHPEFQIQKIEQVTLRVHCTPVQWCG